MGILHIIGTGPGAADLLTIRAVKLLKTARLVFAAASSTREYSSCLGIASKWLPRDARIARLDFPMTSNAEDLEKAWANAASKCLADMAHESCAVFLTLGDPLIYSTFIYLLRGLRKIDPEFKVDIVPGITSFQAAAGRLCQPLCEGRGGLRIISGTAKSEEIRKALLDDDCVIILKAYRNYAELVNLLRQTGRLEKAMLASRVEGPDEILSTNLAEFNETPHYMSLIISPPR